MPITLLYGCCQIETCTSDLAATRAYLETVLDAVPVEQTLAQQIAALLPGTGYTVDHLECGGAVFQINQPAPFMRFAGQASIHQHYLESRGPCVTNLNYYVDDICAARELLISLGAPIHIEGPSNIAPALGDYGPDNTREGAAERPFLFMGTRDLIGFDLEIMEPNFRRLQDQAVQFPAFVRPRPVPPSDLTLARLLVVVADLEATCRATETIFAPASCSRPYMHVESREYVSARVWLGGIEIEYRQPLGENGLSRALADQGEGVHAVVFTSIKPQQRANHDKRWAESIEPASIQPTFRMGSRQQIGFDLLLEPAAAIVRHA